MGRRTAENKQTEESRRSSVKIGRAEKKMKKQEKGKAPEEKARPYKEVI